MPELQLDKCANKSDALKRLAKIGNTINTMRKAKEYVEKTVNVDDVLTRITSSYIIGDFFEESMNMPHEQYDFIEVDPPYSIELTRIKSGDTSGYNEVHPKKYKGFMTAALKNCYTMAKPNAWMVVWFGPEPWAQPMYSWIKRSGWNTTRIWGSWFKAGDLDTGAAGQSLQPKRKLANCYELFFYCWKGNPELNKPGMTNGFPCRPINPA
jgi:hypothetical protein